MYHESVDVPDTMGTHDVMFLHTGPTVLFVDSNVSHVYTVLSYIHAIRYPAKVILCGFFFFVDSIRLFVYV